MKTDTLIAIDIHTHAEVSCWNPFDNYGEEYDRAADKYFGSNRRPTIAETVAYYREKKIGLVMFTVDSEAQLGRRRIPNEVLVRKLRELVRAGALSFGYYPDDFIGNQPTLEDARDAMSARAIHCKSVLSASL